jgi:hypothetical protein
VVHLLEMQSAEAAPVAGTGEGVKVTEFCLRYGVVAEGTS